MGSEGLGKDKVALVCLLRGNAIKRLLHPIAAVNKLFAKGGPHLKDAIAKSEFEDAPGDSRISALVAEVNMLPGLNASWPIFHDL